MNKFTLFIIVALAIVMFSCKSVENITYFPQVGVSDSLKLMDIIEANYESKILPDDELAVVVTAEDINAVSIFNLPAVSIKQKEGKSQSSGGAQMLTYLVDNNGEITFPVLGRIKISGMTNKEAENYLRGRIEAYVKDPIVTLNVLNSKITIMGEVNAPGIYYLDKERVSIVNALGQAGDLTIQGKRTNVLLVREEDGKRSFHRIDLTKPDIFTSPCYYVKKNDFIYVEPNKEKKSSSKYNSQKQINIAITSTVLSGISIIASLVMAFSLK
ncbi:MAG: polysaccharide biosynthesis/export family protein [Bacteroidales bacterium]